MARNSLLRFAFIFALIASAAPAQIITTAVGTNWSFPSGSLAAVNAPLGQLTGVAVDTAGNVFAADSGSNLVVRISAEGTLNVVAGNGIPGFSGDGGPATSASINFAFGGGGVAIDSAGNLYIADYNNNRIRKVSAGTITTVAGNGISGFSGDGGPATSASLSLPAGLAVDSAGNLYIADLGNSRIREVSNGTITTVAGIGLGGGFSGDGGPATSASLAGPGGVAVDSAGSLYIADTGNNRVRKVSSGTITTIATSASLAEPAGVTVDSAGNIYIADTYNERILKLSNGIITTIAGNGVRGFSGDGASATNAFLNRPVGVAIDSAGNLFIADLMNRRVRKVSGGTITTFAGNGNYRFSGDGGPATSASISAPFGVAVDSAGNLYISDAENQRIRKVSGGTITTVAGNGRFGFSGDGGPATGASLSLNASQGVEESAGGGVAVDLAGNFYVADSLNNVIRKVSGGTITTVAGNGTFGFSGDGGPAASAQLSFPVAVAVDSAGSLYIADTGNNRIRKVSNGTITTVAGNGNYGFSGDGGPAMSAAINEPYGVAVDSAGNLYIADYGNNRIRKVSGGSITTVAGNGDYGFFGIDGYSGDGGSATNAPLSGALGVAVDPGGDLYISGPSIIRKVSGGTITTLAGNGNLGYSGDGGPATSASLSTPYGMALDSAGNLYIADLENNRIREVLSNRPFFGSPLAPGAQSLSLSQASGGKPVTANVTAGTTIAENSSEAVPGIAYSAEVGTGSAWLSVAPQNGNTPGLITVTADPLNLSPDTYYGTIVLSVPLANPPTQTVNVQFVVTPGVPAAISVDQSNLSFSYATTSTARSQPLTVSNSGGGLLNFTTSIALNSGVFANWLSVTPQAGTATPANPVALAVRADPSNLPPGTYTGSLTIQGGSAGSVTIPVTMTITTNSLVLLLSQAGLTFTAMQNGGAIPPQTFGVLNLGAGTLNWSVQTSTLSGGDWLNAIPGNGSSNAAGPSGAPLVTVSVNPSGLAPGVYYGQVKVLSAGAANSPQEVVAVLRVLPAGTDVAPIVQPSSLIFSAPAGVSSPSSQSVLVYDPTGTSKSFRSEVNGSGSVVTLPTDATIAPTEPTPIVVQPIVNGLTPGAYQGTLTLQFSDGRVNAVGITFAVMGTGGTSSTGSSIVPPRGIPLDSASSACTPTKLIPVLTTLSPSFDVVVSYPTGLSAQVMDDCGNPLTSGNVTVIFSNGDSPLGLTSLNNGTWQGTWSAGVQSAGQPVKLMVKAVNTQLQISGSSEVDGGISSQQAQPAITPGGVVSAAIPVSFTALAPGSIISIYGNFLADTAASAQSIPLQTTLGNTNVFIGGYLAPLFYAGPGQINALVPNELNTNTTYQLLIQRDLTTSSPVQINIADSQPGAFVSGGSAIVEDYRTATPFLVSPSAPTQAGDVLVLYCAGLGVTNPPVADGVASPANPTAQTPLPVVSIGGQNANVIYSGLVAGLVGLYQVNLTMPAGVTPGNAVPVMLTIAGQTSPAAYIATK